VKPEDHLHKAQQLRQSLNLLLPDPEGHNVAAITELCYGLAHHLIAYGMETKHRLHKDTHVGVPRLLRRHGEEEIAMAFERLDQLRAGRWYGGKGDGEVVKECLKLVQEIEAWVE
jgi:hypothetical protein